VLVRLLSIWLELEDDDYVAMGPTHHQGKEKKRNADLAAAASLAHAVLHSRGLAGHSLSGLSLSCFFFLCFTSFLFSNLI
jgi:hypothetical protein